MVKILAKILLLLLQPFKKIGEWMLKYLILPNYKLLHLIKKHSTQNFENSPNKTISFLTNKNWLYIFVLVLSVLVIMHNLKTKTVAAEDLGKKSLLYKLVQGDEFEEDIVEEQILVDEENKPEQNQTTDYLTLKQSWLAKNEIINPQISTSGLQEVNLNEGLIAETLQKTGISATFSTPQPRENIQEYVVQSGDTISTIAKKFNISINTILWANDLSSLSIIRPGNKLTIPPVSGVLHKVKKGDTLSSIAKNYSVDQEKILSFNKLVDDSQLTIGQMLIVPDGQIKRVYQRTTGSLASVFRAPSSQRNSSGFIWPTATTKITQYFSWRHSGIDIGGRTGTPLYAAMTGTVVKAGWGAGYGNYVDIDHGGGIKTRYGHMSKIYVTRGEEVLQGAVIGAMGSTGWSTGPHLHFEIIINGSRVNPLSYL